MQYSSARRDQLQSHMSGPSIGAGAYAGSSGSSAYPPVAVHPPMHYPPPSSHPPSHPPGAYHTGSYTPTPFATSGHAGGYVPATSHYSRYASQIGGGTDSSVHTERKPVSFYQEGSHIAPVHMAQTNWSTDRGGMTRHIDTSKAPVGYLPQESAPIRTSKPFVLFIKTPDVRKDGLPDGSFYAAFIWNKLPDEVRQHVHVHYLDKHRMKPNGVTGYPQLYDSRKQIFIPFGEPTIVAFLHMVRAIGIEIRMEELHPTAARFDKMVNNFQSEQRQKRSQAQSSAIKDPLLTNWQRPIEQNEKNPYDPSLHADTGEGGLLLDAAPSMSDHLGEIAYVNVFEQSGTAEDDVNLRLGVPINEFKFEGEIDEHAMDSVKKISVEDMEKLEGQRERHLAHLLKKVPPPRGGASSQLKSYGMKGVSGT